MWRAESQSEYMQTLIDNGFGEALLMESSIPHTYPPGKREALHETAKKFGLKMGVWGWYTTEMETDQLASMYVNAQLLSRFYKQVRDGADKIQPISYWSEMEAHHLNNIFTMYSAAQLLWNPDRDPDEILNEISEGIWGPKNGPKIFKALKLIQDVRSGPTWESYWWNLPQHQVGTLAPNKDLQHSNEAIAALEGMKTDTNYIPKFPLPFPPSTFVELMLPHLRQIRQFSEYRVKIESIREAAKQGISKEELTKLANAAWKPVPDYNTWIGTFGQAEERIQEKIINQLSKDLDIQITSPGWMRWRDANRQLEALQIRQRNTITPFKFKSDLGMLWYDFMWTKEKGLDRFQLLLENGNIEKVDSLYQLVNWEGYSRK